jgi:FdrA protein
VGFPNWFLPGVRETDPPHRLIDLGADEYTRGRPHPMIDPALRNEHVERALEDRTAGVVLLDVVIGYGAHADPAGLLVEVLKKKSRNTVVIASVTGTEGDPQVYSRQVRILRAAGVIVAESNAAAARLAALAAGGRVSIPSCGPRLP